MNNPLREAFHAYIDILHQTQPWTMEAFNNAKEGVFREYPTSRALFDAFKRQKSNQ
jgi:hypothetical protein